ncbi:MAG: cyclic nucleotide-binding domain-containing protein, partial [Candidatus Rokuibacteriota bacterium]
MASSPETVAFLREVRLFKDVAVPELTVLASSLRERALKRGQVLIREGDVGEEMFLLRRGSMVISKSVTGRVEQVLARI